MPIRCPSISLLLRVIGNLDSWSTMSMAWAPRSPALAKSSSPPGHNDRTCDDDYLFGTVATEAPLNQLDQ
jgi:hypothetical protein